MLVRFCIKFERFSGERTTPGRTRRTFSFWSAQLWPVVLTRFVAECLSGAVPPVADDLVDDDEGFTMKEKELTGFMNFLIYVR